MTAKIEQKHPSPPKVVPEKKESPRLKQGTILEAIKEQQEDNNKKKAPPPVNKPAAIVAPPI